MTLPDRRYLTHKPQELRNLSASVASGIDLTDPKWVFQTKHDGCHIIILVGVNVVRIFSREGKECTSMPHIAEHFRVNSLPNMAYFGEVWHSNMEFKDISGAFRRKAPQYELEAWLFDAVTLQEFRAGEANRPYAMRIKALAHVLNAEAGVYPVLTKSSVELLQQHVDAYRKLDLKFALDGFMAKDSNGFWKAGVDREGAQLKLKDVMSVDLECVGLIEGEGKFKGMVGALEVLWKGERVTVSGGKLTNDERVGYWAAENPKEVGWGRLIGRIVEVHALGTTPDGKLREPRFQRVRDDKTEPSE